MNFNGDDIHIPEQELYEVHRYFDGAFLQFMITHGLALLRIF
jgi:hypothetical protein